MGTVRDKRLDIVNLRFRARKADFLQGKRGIISFVTHIDK